MKGIGYALEAMVATITILIFSLGAMQVAGPSQDWSDYQREVAAQDLTYSLQASGHLENFVQRGETGSMQTALKTISDRDMEVTGLVSNVPVYETDIGFYTKEDDRITQTLTDDLGQCEGSIGELEDFSEDPVLRTDGEYEEESEYNVTLYFGNTNPTHKDTPSGYDTLWVDNGTQRCQFAEEDGPFYTNEMFFWGDWESEADTDFFDFKEVEDDEEATFYRATQPRNITNMIDRGVNEIRADISMDMVDFEEIESEDYDFLVFREREVLSDIENNREILENHVVNGPALFMMNLEEDDLDDYSFMEDTNFEWMDAGYEDGYDGEATNVAFSGHSESSQIETYFEGLGGTTSEVSMKPPGKLVSNAEGTLEPSRHTVYTPGESYDISDMEVVVEDMDEVEEDDVNGEPESECYGEDYAITEYEGVDFPDYGQVNVINVRLGSDSESCNLDERGVKIDTTQSGEYDSDLILNGEEIELGGRNYIMNTQEIDDCDGRHECIEFLSGAESFIEIAPYRETFSDFRGQKIMFTGYKEEYQEHDLKLLGAMIYWLRGDQYSFQGDEDPEGVSTTAYGSVEEEVYLPYSINLRWSE